MSDCIFFILLFRNISPKLEAIETKKASEEVVALYMRVSNLHEAKKDLTVNVLPRYNFWGRGSLTLDFF